MTAFVTIGDSAEAFGHPAECTEPAPGTVQSDQSVGVTVTNSSSTTAEIASVATATIHFNSHAHDHNSNDGCHNNQSHDIDPNTTSSSVTIDGSPVYIDGSGVGTDPGSGGSVDLSNDTNTTVTES